MPEGSTTSTHSKGSGNGGTTDTSPGPAPPPTPLAVPAVGVPPFDFKDHRTKAVEAFARIRPQYERLATVVKHIIEEAASDRSLKLSSIETRAKTFESFGDKAERPLESDPSRPKYPNPMDDIEDMAGVRVITFLPRDVGAVGGLISGDFEVIRVEDAGSALRESRRFGYASVHYVVRLNAARLGLTEYQKFGGLKAEIQVRTVLQHAWAEIEHDIRYKSAATAPESIGRRFDSLAGTLEMADREFQSIQEADEALRAKAQRSIESGELRGVEITAVSLRSYLDQKFGADLRIADWSYEYWVRRLKDLGFVRLDQVQSALKGYDDDSVSRALWGSRQGQLSRFEVVLMAGMGENYIRRLVKEGDKWYESVLRERLERLRQAKIPIGDYAPAR